MDTEPEESYDQLTRLAAQICGVPVATISLIDSDRQWYKSKVGMDMVETPREISFCNQTIQQTEFSSSLMPPRMRASSIIPMS